MTTGSAQIAAREAIIATARDYVDGWFDGDAERMDRALHAELVKRCVGIEGADPDALETLTKGDMVEATRQGMGRREDAPDREIQITIDRIDGRIASVTCLCHRYVDLLQLADTGQGWQIVNVVWCLR